MIKKARYVFVIAIDVDPEKEVEFNEWYNTEHIPRILKVSGMLSGNRYVAVDGTPKYLTIYELENPEVMKSKAFREAVDTEWLKRIRPYYRVVTRKFYKHIYPEE